MNVLRPRQPSPIAVNVLGAKQPWPMLHHDAQRTGTTGASGIITTSSALRWVYPSADYVGGIVGSPVVDHEGTIYFADTNGKLYALNPDGTDKFPPLPLTRSGVKITSSPGLSGFSRSPDRLYVGTHEQSPQYDNFFAIDLTTWSMVWSLKVPGGTPYAIMAGSSPLVVTDPTGEPVIYVGAADGYLYCIRDHGAKGEKMWGTQLQPPDPGYGFKSSPAMGIPRPPGIIGRLGTIFCGGQDPSDNWGKLFALDPYRGQIINRIQLTTTTGELVSSPSTEMVKGEEVIFAGTSDRQMRAASFDGTNFKLVAGNYGTTAAIGCCPAIYDINSDSKVEAIFGDNSGKIYAVTYDPSLPLGSRWNPLWTFSTSCLAIGSSAAVALAPQPTALQPTVFVGGCLYTGRIYSIKSDGTESGRYDMPSPELCISSSPAVVPPRTTQVGGWVLIGSLDNPLNPTKGRLYAFGPAGRGRPIFKTVVSTAGRH